MKRVVLLLVLYTLNFSARCQDQSFAKKENVIYGMISGMALLMDVYTPEVSNNIGIVYIAGSGWGVPSFYQKVYNQPPLKNDFEWDDTYSGKWAHDLVKRGYTVFMINHRFAPRFHYPDIVEDARRAVRYIRYNADQYTIHPDKIGVMGHSSGGYLAAMLGVMDTPYPNVDQNPIDSVSSKVQAVVVMASPFVLTDFKGQGDLDMVAAYMGEQPVKEGDLYSLSGNYAKASPITHVSKGDAPFIIYYSDNDPYFLIKQAKKMEQKLKDNSIPVELFIDSRAGHMPKPDMDEVDSWFRKYLKYN